MKKVIANLEEAAPSIEFVGAVTPAELYRLAETLKLMAAALEKLSGEKPKSLVKEPIKSSNKETQASEAPKNSKLTVPPETNGQKTRVLENYLKENGITVILPKKKIFTQEQEEILDKLALFLGKNFEICKELYKALKDHNSSGLLSYNLNGATARINNIIKKFCKLLEKAGLLANFQSSGLPNYFIQFNPVNISGNNKHFVDGKWLERYTKQEVKRIVENLYSLDGIHCYEALPNLHIQFLKSSASGPILSSTELDLFFSVGERIFCIEAKRNGKIDELQEFLAKIEPLKLPNQSILFITAENTLENCLEMTQQLNGVKVVGLANFEETLTTMLKATI